jgi:hypothetical protein
MYCPFPCVRMKDRRERDYSARSRVNNGFISSLLYYRFNNLNVTLRSKGRKKRLLKIGAHGKEIVVPAGQEPVDLGYNMRTKDTWILQLLYSKRYTAPTRFRSNQRPRPSTYRKQ